MVKNGAERIYAQGGDLKDYVAVTADRQGVRMVITAFGEVPVKQDRYCPPGEVYLLRAEEWERMNEQS